MALNLISDQKATEKAREFLLKKMEPIKSTSTNISVIQKNILLRYKELYAFLTERYSEVALEVRSTYVNLAGTYYSTLFEKYVKGITRLQVCFNCDSK